MHERMQARDQMGAHDMLDVEKWANNSGGETSEAAHRHEKQFLESLENRESFLQKKVSESQHQVEEAEAFHKATKLKKPLIVDELRKRRKLGKERLRNKMRSLEKKLHMISSSVQKCMQEQQDRQRDLADQPPPDADERIAKKKRHLENDIRREEEKNVKVCKDISNLETEHSQLTKKLENEEFMNKTLELELHQLIESNLPPPNVNC